MINTYDLILIALLIGYIVVVGWYIRSVLNNRKKREDSKHTFHRKDEHAKKRRKGKKCPSCNTTIDRRRTICQHCNYKFEPIEGVEKHPDEIENDNLSMNE